MVGKKNEKTVVKKEKKREQKAHQQEGCFHITEIRSFKIQIKKIQRIDAVLLILEVEVLFIFPEFEEKISISL